MNKTYLNELINSGMDLTGPERALVEEHIQAKSKPVKPEHLNHYKCVAAVRNYQKK